MNLFDTHCHINDLEAFPDPSNTIRAANEAGVGRLVVVGTEWDSMARAVEIAEKHENVYCILGFHPNYTAEYEDSWIPRLRALLGHPKVVALGEIGLDYHWDYSPVEVQMRALHAQLDLAVELEMPIVFHSREANMDLLEILESRPSHPYLVHCFSGNSEEAARFDKLGAYIGIDGPITYPKSAELREILAWYPKERVVLETDSPYMSPVPFRGKPNSPANVPFINEALAKVWDCAPEESVQITTENALRFFRLG